MIDFFTKEEGDQIIAAIREAEKNTSGEIRVHLEVNSQKSTFQDAVSIFRKLNMHRTKQRNGILFFIVPERKEFSILGDIGIDQVVPEGYWKDVTSMVEAKFREGKFSEGVCQGVLKVGEKLKEYFPFQKDDINELSDDISYG